MKLHRALDYAHELMKQNLAPGDIAIDGTCGNGHDTLLLSELVGSAGHVYGFDIQEAAIQSTADRLHRHHLEQAVTLIQDSHANFPHYLEEAHTFQIQAGIFNLGYLPGSDKSIITEAEHTLKAVHELLAHLKVSGILAIVVYHGHEGGQAEKNALLEFAGQLDQTYYNVLQYGFINQVNTPPFLLAIEKKAKPE
ncbi:class I SAM-dependent methyltransferase [Thalassobacillus sp. CUG 92003]|uniref:class I SAM-dependent methyltransferase n=1 Tax=Thalassobacillus sp. CUG 92003 TaxID=2736641 RepID=UPI0015E71BDC|nr:class I SAM-dependent methyltransferase [Thalassobacillus sp. CUG 92003]